MKLGTKLECHSCGAKFYDLERPDPICPKCGASQAEFKSSASSSDSKESRAAKKLEDEPAVDSVDVDEDDVAPEDDDLDIEDFDDDSDDEDDDLDDDD
ncbi:MAG: FYDLN acid domain-containing protein [Acidobacteria bacterium]|nr:FYDLN acid domain-containing protein [Acidobacteriota bacterium]